MGGVAAPLLAGAGAVARLGPLLVRAVADAVDQDDRTLVGALRRLADDLPEDDGEIAAFAVVLAEVRLLPPVTRRAVRRVVSETIALATPRRRW